MSTSILKSRRFVFIVTYGRSGSTLLQAAVNASPAALIRGENHNILLHIFHAYKAARATVEIAQQTSGQQNDPWFGSHLIHPECFADHLLALFVSDILQPPPDARIIGLKEIRYFEQREEFNEFLDFLRDRLGDVRFIFNRRDWRSVSKSGWWVQHKPEIVREEIEYCDRLMLSYADRNPEISIVMEYKQYCCDVAKLTYMLDFIEAPHDPVAIDKVLNHKLTH